MSIPILTKNPPRDAFIPLQVLADQAFSRAAGAPLIPGNKIRLLKDAIENYPVWLEAIRTATRTIHFESYIIHADDIGEQFATALVARAREGVRVRLIYDWMGALGEASYRFWKRLKASGVEVRCFNPPRLDSPMGWLRRDHRKMLSVDGRIGFVTGLCVGHRWVGYADKGIEPWRDTGVEITGPAVADLEYAFAQMWSLLGSPIPSEDIVDAEDLLETGDVALRIVASYPNMAGLYRFDQLIAALARRSIWLTDAYFLATAPYVKALGAAAMDGVDVRLLLPRASDLPVIRALSRAGYRTLLESGVRIFEWNGPMLHAKTAVADNQWARVGSTNLNLASWIGNWELDVVVENEAFAQEMNQMYEEDLANSTEIVLAARKLRRALPSDPQPRRGRLSEGSAGRALRSLLRTGNTVGAAISSRQALGPSELSVLVTMAVLLLCLALVAFVWPLVIIVPAVVFPIWIAVSLLIRAYRLHATYKRALASNVNGDSDS
jgi:cardiolipin synthase A/B